MRICKHHIGFFGDSIPFDSYLFLTLAKHTTAIKERTLISQIGAAH
jgi:predicted metalloprotease with PDZ domain